MFNLQWVLKISTILLINPGLFKNVLENVNFLNCITFNLHEHDFVRCYYFQCLIHELKFKRFVAGLNLKQMFGDAGTTSCARRKKLTETRFRYKQKHVFDPALRLAIKVSQDVRANALMSYRRHLTRAKINTL